jgi:hypothetical protein
LTEVLIHCSRCFVSFYSYISLSNTINSLIIPVTSCGMPMTLHKGSFRKVHPALQTVISSFHTICQTLEQAEPDWWKDCKDNSMTGSNNENSNVTDDGNQGIWDESALPNQTPQESDNEDEEGMIDLFGNDDSKFPDHENAAFNNDDDDDDEEEEFDEEEEEEEEFETAKDSLSFQSCSEGDFK